MSCWKTHGKKQRPFFSGLLCFRVRTSYRTTWGKHKEIHHASLIYIYWSDRVYNLVKVTSCTYERKMNNTSMQEHTFRVNPMAVICTFYGASLSGDRRKNQEKVKVINFLIYRLHLAESHVRHWWNGCVFKEQGIEVGVGGVEICHWTGCNNRARR